MTPSPKERAITKTNLEIEKEISRVIDLAKQCGLGEIQYFLHYLHFSRLLPGSGNIPEDKQQMMGVYIRQLNEACKYIIQILAKHSKNEYIKNQPQGYLINSFIVQLMIQLVISINSKFEMTSFLTMFNNLEVTGERDQEVKLNLEEVTKDERLNKFFYYAFRADKENDFQKENPKQKDDFLNHFMNEYRPYSDLFMRQFDISVDEFIQLIDWILNTITTEAQKKEKDYVYLEDDRVDIQAYKTIMLFSSSMFFKKTEILEQFGAKYHKILKRLTFNPNEFDERQLKYNLIARQPIIEKDEFYIVSPEILLDSMFVNSHYSLLEASDVKEEYKARYSRVFVDKISGLAKEFGYEEFARDFELYEGKNQIGDLDVILKNAKNEFLLIEAKNHTLPLDVYFHDHEATEKRLKQLSSEWEKKVEKRKQNVEVNHDKYGINSDFKYIIVTKVPEIISHFSNYLIVSLDEFGHWLNFKNPDTSFDDIFKKVYNIDDISITEEQLTVLQNDLMPGLKFKKE
jgi:hypothetical protein